MTFTDFEFTHGNPLTEPELDGMMDNNTHVREEANYSTLYTSDGWSFQRPDGPGRYVWVSIFVDGTNLGGSTTSATGDLVLEIDLAGNGINAGIRKLEVRLYHYDYYESSVIRFYRTPDMDYMSAFFNISANASDGTATATISDVSVIGHREAKSWTA